MSENTVCEVVHEKISIIEERLDRRDASLASLPLLLEEIKSLSTDFENIKKDIVEMKEVVVAWGNIKGFGKTMKFVSTVLKTCAAIALASAALYSVFIAHEHITKDMITKIGE